MSIHYYSEGTGEAILFLHSLGTSGEVWEEQIRQFKQDYQVIALDFNGHGQSGASLPFTIEEAARDALRVLDQVGVAKAHIVGISMGGHVAMEMVKQAPERIQTMVLADTWAYMEPAIREERTKLRMGRLREIGMEEFSGELAKNSLAACATIVQVNRLDSIIQCTAETYESAWGAVHGVDFRDVLPTIQVPVTVLVGDEDKSTPLPYAQEIAGAIPGSVLEVVPNGGHLSHITNPEFFNTQIMQMIKGGKADAVNLG